MSNLRQVSLGFAIWLNQQTNRYPWEISTSEGGTMELIGRDVSPHFQTISNFTYDSNSRILVCPTDIFRKTATNYAMLTDSNISYFVNLDASFKHPSPATSIIAGDRHLQRDGLPVKPGLVTLKTNMNIGWTRELHRQRSTPVGVLAFADGHVEMVKTDLNRAFGIQGVVSNRFAIP